MLRVLQKPSSLCRKYVSIAGSVAALGVLFTTHPSYGEDRRSITVSGEVNFDAEVEVQPVGVRVRGRLTDELRHPLPNGSVRFDLPTRGCFGNGKAIPANTDFPPNPDGTICAMMAGTPSVGLVALAPHHREKRIVLHATDAPPFPLELVEVPARWDLDDPSQPLHVGISLRPGSSPLEQATLSVSCSGKLVPLSAFRLEKRGLTFVDQTSAPPRLSGRCALLLGPIGGKPDPRTGVELELRLPVRLSVQDLSGSRLTLFATARDEAVREGMIEARGAEGRYLVGENVADGKAILELSKVAHPEELTFRYVSTTTRYRSGPPLKYRYEPYHNILTSGWVHSAFLAAFFGWIVFRWKTKPRPVVSAEILSSLRPPGVSRVAATDVNEIRGVVRDAHTNEPIASAAIEITKISFQEQGSVQKTRTDGEGGFVIALTDRAIVRLRVTAPEYVKEETTTGPGRIEVLLAHRRRAVLALLMKWLRERRRTGARLPTPGEVEERALSESRPKEAAWAAQIDAGAYGPLPLDEDAIAALAAPELESTSVDGSKGGSL